MKSASDQKLVMMDLERWLSAWEYVLLLQRAWVHFLVPIWALTTWISSSRESHASSFWVHQFSYHMSTYTHPCIHWNQSQKTVISWNITSPSLHWNSALTVIFLNFSKNFLACILNCFEAKRKCETCFMLNKWIKATIIKIMSKSCYNSVALFL